MDLVSWFLIFIFCFLGCFDSAQGGQNSSQSRIYPGNFMCKSLGNLSFPFYESTKPDRGLCKVDCGAIPYPTIEFEGIRYQVLENHDVFLKVKDPFLENFLNNKSCYSFDKNLSFPFSPSITYRVSPVISLFKCETRTKAYEELIGYRSYNGCESFTLYYNHSFNVSPQSALPIDCPVIYLPALSGLGSKSNESDLFDLLTAEVSLGWTVSDECNQCYYDRGGQCQTDNTTNSFLCHTTKGKSNVRMIVITVAVSSCLVGILGLVFCFRNKNVWYNISFWESKAEDHQIIETFLKNYGSYAPKRYSYSEVKKITSRFNSKLGQGGYGCVYKGSLRNGSHVAVKVLHELKGGGEEFINEVASISRTSHVNIVSLVGFCFEGRKRALIYEYMPNGSLEKFIYDGRSNRDRQLGWPTLSKIAVGIARGLEYLHRGCSTRILHFDIKPHNILLDQDFVPKIADFGLAKLCIKKESIVSMLGARGTIGYIAPEIVCRNFGGVSHKSDVYSYGMMVLEMVGGRKNVDVVVDHTSEIYFPHWIYRQIEQDEELRLNGILSEDEKECARKMVIVSLWCIQTDPSNRPSMTKVVEMLEGNLDSLQLPPKPYLYSPSRSEVDSSKKITPLSLNDYCIA